MEGEGGDMRELSVFCFRGFKLRVFIIDDLHFCVKRLQLMEPE
jgi:hypothetical protein